MNTSEFPATPAGAFPTTHWSVVVNAGANSTSQARVALETLCRHYWYPLYAFVRRQGRSHHEAEDCTQEFLARLLAADSVARVRREHGRFRTFLLTALRNFLTDDWRRAQREKRGGGRPPNAFDAQAADERFAREAADRALTPDQAFDRSWARDMMAATMEELHAEYAGNGRGALFEALAPLVWGHASAESAAQLAARLGLKEQTFTVALHRLRRRVGEKLRAAVAETVVDDAEIDNELRHLIAAVADRRTA